MNKEDVIFLRLFGAIFAGVGSIFAIIGIIIGLNTRSFVSQAITAPGTVINLEKSTSRDSKGRSSTLYYPIVKFTPSSGDPTVFEGNVGSRPPAYTKGQQVEVIYHPQQPKSARIYSGFELWFLPGIFTGMGSIFVVIGGVPIVISFRRRRQLQ